MCPVVLRNSFGNIFAKYMHKCEHTFWRNKAKFRPDFLDAFMYIAIFSEDESATHFTATLGIPLTSPAL